MEAVLKSYSRSQRALLDNLEGQMALLRALGGRRGGRLSESKREVWAEAHVRIGDLRGMCSDERPHEELDVYLAALDDFLWEMLGEDGPRAHV